MTTLFIAIGFTVAILAIINMMRALVDYIQGRP